jgi:hypothetical protein
LRKEETEYSPGYLHVLNNARITGSEPSSSCLAALRNGATAVEGADKMEKNEGKSIREMSVGVSSWMKRGNRAEDVSLWR